MPTSRLAGALAALFLLFSCGGGDGGTGPDLGFLIQSSVAPPATAAAGAALPIAVKILHKEAGGTTTPVAGKSVTLTVTAGGGTVNGSASTSVTSGADGSVSATWTLGTALGTQTIRGSVSATEFLDFTLTATQPPPSQLGLTVQPSTSGQIGVVLAQQPTVQLKDAGGSSVPQAGVPVTVSIATGGGTLGGTLTVNSNASGVATFTDLMVTGTIGLRTLSFAATLNGTPATVTSGNVLLLEGPPAAIAVTTQPSATAVGSVALAQQPVVQVRDASGNNVALAGIVVTAAVTSGPGTISGSATATTDAAGKATFIGLGVTGGTGPVNVTLTFTATVTGQSRIAVASPIAVVPPPKLLITTQPTAQARSNIEFFQQPAVQLADGLGNEVHQAGVAITASLASGSGQLVVGLVASPPAAPPAGFTGSLTMLTDANGRVQFHDLTIFGTGTHTIQFSAAGYAPAVTDLMTLSVLLVNAAPNGLGEGGAFSAAANSESYIRFIVPAGTNELIFDTYGSSGDVALYVRQGDYPTLADHAACTLNATGPVQRCVFTGTAATPGQWYLVSHGTTAFTNVRMQAAAYGPACAQTPIILGVTIGPRTFAPATDCGVPFLVHRYSFNSASQQAILLNVTATSFLGFTFKQLETPFARYDFPASGGTSVTWLMPPKQFDAVIFQFAGTQTYSFTATSVSPDVIGCAERFAFSGVNMPLTLTAGDCPGITAGTFSDRIYLAVGGGQTITISMTPAPGSFAPRLRLMPGFLDQGIPGSISSTVDGSLTAGATLVFTNSGPVTAAFTMEATSVLAGQTGSYTLRIDQTPNYYNLAPPAFLKAIGLRP